MENKNPDWLFIGVQPGGIVYADKRTEENGDYKKLAFHGYDGLNLILYTDDPEAVSLIKASAEWLFAQRGDAMQISASGSQTVLIGGTETRNAVYTVDRLRLELQEAEEKLGALIKKSRGDDLEGIGVDFCRFRLYRLALDHAWEIQRKDGKWTEKKAGAAKDCMDRWRKAALSQPRPGTGPEAGMS